jgi:cell shape-determining protein MreD
LFGDTLNHFLLAYIWNTLVDFNTFKINVVETTGLAKDALHIYVGVGVYLLSMFILRPIIKNQTIRAFLALLVVISVALLGEYFDNRHIIVPKGLLALKGTDIKASIHDLINTCLLPFVLFALNKWTRIFQASSSPSKLLKKTR